jgi:hypothetical protein
MRPRGFSQPDGSELYVNVPLTTVAVAFLQGNDEFVADRVFPNVPVQQQAGSFWKYKRGNWDRAEAKVRAPATESVGGGWEVEQDTYRAAVYAFHKDVADQDRANQLAPFDLDRDATAFVTRQLLLTREVAWVQKFFASGVWADDRTGVAAAPTGSQFLQWNDPASNPVKDIRTRATVMAAATGFRPNKLVIAPHVLDALVEHPAIIGRIQYSQRGIVDTDLLRALFDVDEVMVTRAIHNTGPEGGTDAYGYILGKSALLVYAPETPGLMQPSAGYTFTWNRYLPGTGMGVAMDRFRMPELKADRIEGEMAWDLKVIAAELGTFFSAAVA